MSSKAEFKFTDPGEVDLTLTLTLKAREWRHLVEQMKKAEGGRSGEGIGELHRMIAQMVEHSVGYLSKVGSVTPWAAEVRDPE